MEPTILSTHDDYQLRNFQGQVLYDSAQARIQRNEAMTRREGEPFTASPDCPQCGVVDVHWLEKPRLDPFTNDDSPAGKASRRINGLIECVMFGAPLFDPPGNTVMRVCKSCGYRWGQS